MKVVIAHGGNIGFQAGGTNRVLAFARALAENGFDISPVVPEPVGEVPESIRESVTINTVPVKAGGNPLLRALMVPYKAKKLAEKENAILQIEHSTLGGIASLLGCSNYVLDVHDLEFDGDLYRSIPLALKAIYYLERRAVKKALKIIVVSEEMKRFISNNWSIDEDKIEVIPNGVKENILDFKETNAEAEGLISHLGILHHAVDYDKIIELAKSLDSKAQIYIIGDGPMKSEFLRMIEDNNVNNIKLTGFLQYPSNTRAYEIMSKSQVCIIPRKPNTHVKVAANVKIMTYAALGKPIAADRDGIADVFEKCNAALISNPSEPREFIENVQKLLDDYELRKKLGENAKNLVKDFTWERQGEKLVKVYNSIFNDRGELHERKGESRNSRYW